MANWELATLEKNIFKIEPLKGLCMNPRVKKVKPNADYTLYLWTIQWSNEADLCPVQCMSFSFFIHHMSLFLSPTSTLLLRTAIFPSFSGMSLSRTGIFLSETGNTRVRESRFAVVGRKLSVADRTLAVGGRNIPFSDNKIRALETRGRGRGSQCSGRR
jgi:hypothetical protein